MPAATVDELISLAKLLPPEQRELLLLRLQVELLPEDADPAVEAAWIAEAERRLDAMDRGEMATVPWEQVRRDLGLP